MNIDGMILDNFKLFTEFTKQNPVIAGVVSLWGLSVGTWLLRHLPKTVKNFIERQFTVRVEFHNSDKIFYHLDCWFNDQKFIQRFRTLKVKSGQWGDSDDTQITAGFGYHWFFHKYRLYKYTRTKQDSQGIATEKETIEITLYGRSQKKVRALVAHIVKEIMSGERDDEIKLYEYSRDYWSFLTKIPKRPWESLVLNGTIKEDIEQCILDFANEDEVKWKLENGINNKITIQLEGPPGTGKTTFVKTLASKLNKDIYILSLNEVSDKGLRDALNSVPDNAIVLMEDIDSCSSTKQRKVSRKETVLQPVEGEQDNSSAMSLLSIQGILNALDGITSNSGRIVFTTTNHPENIDKAIMRKGRINHRFYFGSLDEEAIRKFLNRFFDDIDFSTIIFKKDVIPADLEAYILEYKNDIKSILEKIAVSYHIENKDIEVMA
jgi:chaperone BCS1